ncbi:MAG: hypothetical protein GXP26_04570 [Planctomycetes bacterium]|nr:hypothetical protein [Planctomycetota bacterium]
MSKIALENVLALNEELAALAEAGIPSNLAPGASPDALAGVLEQINSSLSLRSNLGQTLVSATSENPELPSVYRSALEAGVRSDCLSATLDGISRQATAENELRSIVGRSLIPPLIVSMLAYVGFVVLCLNFSPTIEGMYTQVGQTPSRSASFLIAMRGWLPYWATIFPLLILGAVILWLRGWGSWQRLVPGARRYTAAVRNANFARQLTLLVENGLSLEESLPVAAAVTGDKGLIAACATLLEADAKNKTSAADSKALLALPPILRWALTGNLGNQSLPEILRFAEKNYRHRAERRAATWRVALPATLGALLSGFVVLAYGLSLFGPFVQLLEDIAR